MIYNSPYKYWPDENDPKQIIKYQYNCYFNGKDIFFRIENSGFVKSCDDHDVLRLIFSGIGWLRPIQCCCLHGLFWNGRLWCIWAFPLISDSHHRDEPMKPGINKTGFLKVLYKFVSKSKVKEVSIISPGLKCFCGHLYEYSTINLAKINHVWGGLVSSDFFNFTQISKNLLFKWIALRVVIWHPLFRDLSQSETLSEIEPPLTLMADLKVSFFPRPRDQNKT